MSNNLIRFDWAMKRLLRDKSNYVVLEGFLSTLLGEDLHICRFLESESNQTDASDKFNRADMLVEDDKGQLLIIEVQNNRELDYFHRMLSGYQKPSPNTSIWATTTIKSAKFIPSISFISTLVRGKITSTTERRHSGDYTTRMMS